MTAPLLAHIDGRDVLAAVLIAPDPGHHRPGIAIETVHPGMTDDALAYLLRQLADELSPPAMKAAS